MYQLQKNMQKYIPMASPFVTNLGYAVYEFEKYLWSKNLKASNV